MCALGYWVGCPGTRSSKETQEKQCPLLLSVRSGEVCDIQASRLNAALVWKDAFLLVPFGGPCPFHPCLWHFSCLGPSSSHAADGVGVKRLRPYVANTSTTETASDTGHFLLTVARLSRRAVGPCWAPSPDKNGTERSRRLPDGLPVQAHIQHAATISIVRREVNGLALDPQYELVTCSNMCAQHCAD